MKIYDILKKLEKIQSVSGNESAVHGTIKNLLGDGFKYKLDPLGNLIATLPSKSGKSIMLCAHADSPGFICTHIETSGLIRLASVGSLKLDTFVGSPVVFENGVKGILACSGGQKGDDIKASSLVCDICAKDGKAAEKRVHVGDRFAASGVLTRLSGSIYSAPALSSKLGCAALVLAALEIKEQSPAHTVSFVFSAQNQAGARGVGAAVHSINPDIAINIGASPSDRESTVKLSGGAVIKLCDKSSICTKSVAELLFDAAKSQNKPIQTEISDFTGSDTAAILKACGGVPTGEVSIPVRYSRTPSETADIKDAESVVCLICQAVKAYN